ncbi:MAG: hypothetical protein O7F70_03650 [Gemmatimonadetes bacterium]|nr:hypothetical protein [Gemmatimonadota bacterium]
MRTYPPSRHARRAGDSSAPDAVAAPGELCTNAVFRGGPLSFPDDGQARTVEHEMDALAGRDRSKPALQMLAAPGERRVIGCGEVKVHQREQRVQEPFGLAEREMVDEPQG